MFDWFGLFGVIGLISIACALVLLGMLSRRLGRVTRMTPYYTGFHISAFLVMIGVIARLFHLTAQVAVIENLDDNILWVLLYNGAPMIGVMLGVVFSWRYWSWLLAERS